MPFTLSHSAAVLPFRGKGLFFSALVVGSMSPDFEYLVHLQARGRFSHSTPGLFLFSLPAGLLVLWLFHNIWKKSVFTILPDSLQSRLSVFMGDFPFLPASRLLMICLSIIIGGTTHIVWDAFTHSYGWGVRKLPFLSYRFLNVYNYPVILYKILQHGSAMIGIVLVFLCCIRWFKKADVAPINSNNRIPKWPRFSILFLMLLISMVSGVIYGILKVRGIDSFLLLIKAVGFAIPFTVFIMIIEITIMSIVMNNVRKFRE
jgi:hypothetical protein